MAMPSPITRRPAPFLVPLLGIVLVFSFLVVPRHFFVNADSSSSNSEGKSITIDYPESDSIFPPDIMAPTFLWRDAESSARTWRIDISFADSSESLHVNSNGDPMRIGEIDPRCISNTNKPPSLTPEQAAAHTWTPDAATWATIKMHSVDGPATVAISGISGNNKEVTVSQGRVTISTSKDAVGAPIFYRDVPLMPSEGEKNFIQPLAPTSIYLINWRLRDISQPESRVVMHDLHSCANCHSFSADGKTMGIDVDGPKNDKGLYAVVPIQKQMAIRNEDMVSWNNDMRVGQSRVGFMSQVSPDGKYVLSTFAGQDQSIPSAYYVTNFKDYNFLQVFYPTRGILAWYDRATGRRQPLPGADDPRYVQTDGVWSPDGKYIVFARAEAKDPNPQGQKPALHANDPNEAQIQYDLYRVPFNDGKGGQAERIAGASDNGMSNNFPKVSPDGRWIVFVKCRNGQLMRPDSQLYIVPATGGVARRMRANTKLMNSWHSFSPNGRWLVFSSKSRSPYTQMFLTHVDENGNDSPAILIENSTAANRAVNIPEFVNIPADGMLKIDTPATEFYRLFDVAKELEDAGSPETIAAFEKALALSPEDVRGNTHLANALARKGRLEEAIRHYQTALKTNPRYLEARTNLGAALAQEGKLDQAIPEYRKALEVDARYPDAHADLGLALFRQGKLDEAIAELESAVEISPDFTEAHTNLGVALARKGRQDEAIAHFEK